MRYTWPFERHTGTLKGKVMNPTWPKSSIVQRTVTEDVSEYVI